MRNLVVLLMLACAGAQPATGSALLASVLALESHGREHTHSVSVVADEGHLDLVLAHAEDGAHDTNVLSSRESVAISFSQADHVLHLTGEEKASATARRTASDAAPLLAIAIVPPFAAPRAAKVWHRSPEPRARSAAQLRTVVLRV